MSEKAAEYLKRTCLICGCHTNQTLNIYEPRNGPNIVELIQAKFKFQPVNEDKYLCFSCNNWLINWHSLQASNSNEAESHSGTFRPQMNSTIHKEKSKNPRQQTQSNHLYWQTNETPYRPTAKVRPWRISKPAQKGKLLRKQKNYVSKSKWMLKIQRKYHDKRRLLLRNVRVRHSLTQSNTSNCFFIIYNDKPKNLSFSTYHLPTTKFKKEKFVEKENKDVGKQNKHLWEAGRNSTTRGYSNVECESNEKTPVIDYHKHCLNPPLLDGKIISMLRRVGTTLSFENCDDSPKTTTPLHARIMSPTKLKPQWKRQLDKDEVLLGFDSTISEVLPQVIQQRQQKTNGNYCVPEVMAAIQAKRKAYRVSMNKDDSQYVYPQLPEGLTISLI